MAGPVPAIGRGTLPLRWADKRGHDSNGWLHPGGRRRRAARPNITGRRAHRSFIQGGSADGQCGTRNDRIVARFATPSLDRGQRPLLARRAERSRHRASRIFRSGSPRTRSIPSDDWRRSRRRCRHGNIRRTADCPATRDRVWNFSVPPYTGRRPDLSRRKDPGQPVGDLPGNLEQVHRVCPSRSGTRS